MLESGVEKYGNQFADYAKRAQQRLQVLDDLKIAVDRALAVGIPVLAINALAPDPGKRHASKFRWRGFVASLAGNFHMACPGRTKEDGYRFVQATMPFVTGDKPSLENIKEILKSGNREKRPAENSQEKLIH